MSRLNNDVSYNLQQLVRHLVFRGHIKPGSAHLGFTIVELLIVIVVIGILAAIVIVAYNGIQDRAYDTTVKNDLKNAAKSIELYKINTTGLYPASGSQILAVQTDGRYPIKPSTNAYLLTINNFAYCYISGGASFAMVAKSRTNKAYYISDTSGGVQDLTNWQSSVTNLCPAAGIGVAGSGTGTWGYANGVGWQAWATP